MNLDIPFNNFFVKLEFCIGLIRVDLLYFCEVNGVRLVLFS